MANTIEQVAEIPTEPVKVYDPVWVGKAQEMREAGKTAMETYNELRLQGLPSSTAVGVSQNAGYDVYGLTTQSKDNPNTIYFETGNYEIPVKTAEGDTVKIDRDLYEAIQKAEPQRQVEQYQKLGLLSQRTLESVREQSPELHDVLLKQGLEAYNRALEDYYVTLSDKTVVRKKEFESLPQEIQNAGLTGGKLALESSIKRYNEVIADKGKQLGELGKGIQESIIRTEFEQQNYEKAQREFEKYNTQLPDGKWVNNADLADIKDTNNAAYTLITSEGYSKYLDKIEDSLHVLSKYQNDDGTYDLAGALSTRDSKVDNAVILFFSDKDVRDIENKVLPARTMGTNEYKSLLQSIPPAIPLALVQAQQGARQTPFPHDDLVVGAIIGAIAIGGGIAAGIKYLQAHREKTGTDIKPENLILVSTDGKAVSASNILKYTPDYELLDLARKGTPAFPITQLAKPGTPATPVTVFEHSPVLKYTPDYALIDLFNKGVPGFKAENIDVVVMTDPVVTQEELSSRAGGVLLARAEVEVAASKIRETVRALHKTRTIEINWDKIMENAERAKTQENIKKAFETLNRSFSRDKVQPELARFYYQAQREYLQKRAFLQEAQRQYVEALNPVPIKGKISEPITEAIIGLQIAKMAGIRASENTASAVRELVKSATKTAQQTYTKAIAEGKTEAQAQTKANTALETALQNLTQTQTQTRTQTQLQTKTQAQAQTKTQTGTQALTQTATRTLARTATKPAVREATRTAVAEMTRLKKPRKRLELPSGSDDEKLERIRSSKGGAFGWTQGKLHGKPVHHIVVSPFRQKDKFTIMGNRPEGVTFAAGKRQAYKSISLMKGQPPDQPVKLEGGAVDPVVSPVRGRKGVRIEFFKDTKIGGIKPKTTHQKGKKESAEKKTVYQKGNVRISEEPRRLSSLHSRRQKVEPRTVELGMDIVQKGRKRRIRLQ
jgi:hypothetical protein